MPGVILLKHRSRFLTLTTKFKTLMLGCFHLWSVQKKEIKECLKAGNRLLIWLSNQPDVFFVCYRGTLFNLTSIWNRIVTFSTCLQGNLIILRGHLKELVWVLRSAVCIALSHVSIGDKVNMDNLQLFFCNWLSLLLNFVAPWFWGSWLNCGSCL